MAKLVFILLVIAEIALYVFTLAKQRSKKEWVRNRLIANVAEVALFVLLTFFPGVDFGFRFKILFYLLVLRLLCAGCRFLCDFLTSLKKEPSGKRKNPVIMTFGTLFTILITFLSMVPAFVFADYHGKQTTGSYDVGMKHVILVDQNREETFENDGSKREVPIYFYYPENAKEGETYPLVVFSHGAFGFYESNYSTYAELVSNGYVVVAMDHPYHAIFTNDTDDKLIIVDTQFLNDAMNVGNSDPDEEEMAQILETTTAWITLRTTDMNFVIDTLESAKGQSSLPEDTWFLCDSKESEIVDVLNLIDYGKIGLMGHSMGGATSVTVGRERDDISAVIDLDGTMLGEKLNYQNGELLSDAGPYPVPLLSMDNESHYRDGEAEGSYYVNNAVIRDALNGQHTYIVGAEHMNFTDLPMFSPMLASMFGTGTIDADHCMDIVNEIVLKFMDSNLKGEGDYRVEEFYE